MSAFIGNIAEQTIRSTDFRRVLFTGGHLQLVLMTLLPGEEIGEEVHEHTDQFLRVEAGTGEVWIDGHSSPIEDDTAVVVPAGARHNVVNTGDQALKLYTLYAPPEHADGTIHRTRKDAVASERAHRR